MKYHFAVMQLSILTILSLMSSFNIFTADKHVVLYEGLDGGSWYSLITKNLAIYSLSLKFWLIH